MKTAKTPKPIIITDHPMMTILGVCFLLFSPVMLFSAIHVSPLSDRLLLVLMFLLDVALSLALLITPRMQRIGVLAEGVTIEQKRRNIRVAMFWDRYRFMYTLDGYKVSYYLFSPVALTKSEQYDAYSRCISSREIPFVDGDYMILPANLYPTEIKERIPAHIRIMPTYECGTLWNKGKGL